MLIKRCSIVHYIEKTYEIVDYIEKKRVVMMGDLEENYFGKNMRDINLKEFFEVIKKRYWMVIIITILLTFTGYFYSNLSYTPIYETSTRIIIDADNNYMNTLMVMIKDPSIMEKVQDELGISRSPESIANQIVVNRVDESLVINISVTDQNPKVAMDIANLTASTFKSEVKKLLDFSEVQLLTEAKENKIPINENKNKMAIAGLIAGLVIGTGLVFLIDSLDETVNKKSQVEGITNVPVIGVVSKMKVKKAPKKEHQKVVDLREEKVSIHE